MLLCHLLESATDIDYVRLVDGWMPSRNILYDGEYAPFVKKMRRRGWANASVMKWALVGRTITVEINAGQKCWP
jgi:hypothetical protein